MEEKQKTIEDVRAASPQKVVEWREAGLLADLLSETGEQDEFTAPEDAPSAGETFTSLDAYLRKLTPQQIVDLRRNGQIPGVGSR